MKLTGKMRDLTLKNAMILSSYIALLILGVIYFKNILFFIGKIFDIIQPFILGFVLAFILNIPMKFLIKKLPIQDEKRKKIVSAILSVFLFFFIVFIVVIIVMPQVIDNIKSFVENLPNALKQIEEWIDYLLSQVQLSPEVVTKIEEFQTDFGNTIISKFTSWVPSIAIGFTHFTSKIVNIFMGLVMAIYMLFSKDKLIRQMEKLGQAFLKENQMNQLKSGIHLVSTTFENFLAGQLTESIIIGVLCYIGCIFLDIPYASIAAIVIGFTNVIPYFGPIIGAALSSILIFFVSPIKTVIFLIFSTLLQQFESNLIYPHVVGGSIGLWVLFAVSVGGGLFGIPGMIFGLPTFSVVYELLRRWTNQRLKEKEKLKREQVEETVPE